MGNVPERSVEPRTKDDNPCWMPDGRGVSGGREDATEDVE
jgi:hypothetical protein